MKLLRFYCLLVTFAFFTCFQVSAQGKKPLLNHIARYVVNLKTATDFYTNIIGLDTMPEPFHDGKHTWLVVGDYSHLHLIQGSLKVTPTDKNNHLCFSVPSLEDVIARLDKSKIDYYNWAGDIKSVTTRVDGIKQIYFTDPDGYWIEINNDYPNK